MERRGKPGRYEAEKSPLQNPAQAGKGHRWSHLLLHFPNPLALATRVFLNLLQFVKYTSLQGLDN